MKIRTASQLQEALDHELAWRKRELTTLLFTVRDSREAKQATLIRAAVPILYSHWEGFCKRAGEFYLQFVAVKGHPYERLKSNFVALGCRGAIREAALSNRTQLYVNVVEFLTFNQGNSGKFNPDGAIDTDSNLNSGVFRNLLDTIGLRSDDVFDSKYLLIDGSLLKARNEIAHGSRTEVGLATYDQLHSMVIELIDHLRDEIENAAVTEFFLKNSSSASTAAPI